MTDKQHLIESCEYLIIWLQYNPPIIECNHLTDCLIDLKTAIQQHVDDNGIFTNPIHNES